MGLDYLEIKGNIIVGKGTLILFGIYKLEIKGLEYHRLYGLYWHLAS